MKKILLALSALTVMAFTGDYEDGLAAYQNKDYKKSFELFKKACENKHADGCYKLGAAYAVGIGTDINTQKLLESYTKACDMNSRGACFELATIYILGYPGIQENEVLGNKLMKKACGQGDRDACEYFQ